MGIQLSYSAAQKYINSPLSFFLHYYLKLRPVETGSALAFGASVDAGLNVLLIAKRDGKLETHEDGYEPLGAYLAQAKVVFDEAFNAFKATDIKYSKADMDTSILTSDDLNKLAVDPSIPVANLCLKRKGHMILNAYSVQVLPRLEKVILVQHNVSLNNEMGDSLIGVVDLMAQIDGKVYILDNKTSSIKYAEDAVRLSQQLGTYYEALKDEYKVDGVGFIIIPKNIRKKKEPLVPIEIQLGKVDEKTIIDTFAMYDEVLDGVKNGRFQCSGCNESPWPCSYRRYCESDGKDLTGLKYSEKK